MLRSSRAYKDCIQFAKIAIPHIALYAFILFYLLAGAWTFARMEDSADREQQLVKLHKIRDVYLEIAEVASRECPIASWDPRFRSRLYRSLFKLSSHMEGREFPMDPDADEHLEHLVTPSWTKMPSILYALSILSTTGYLSAVPLTALGQLTSVIYGLLGIPLMVLAAVDIGRFLSDIVLRIYRKEKKRNMMELVETKAIPEASKICGTPLKPRVNRTTDAVKYSKGLPLSVNASILLIFCMLGGLIYIIAGGQKTFLEAFFVTFNLVANLTMAEMPNDLNHILTLFYILVFVIFGLAVLSMCGNLAAGELKGIFMKIHYFGRKISWRRRMKKQEQSLAEILRIIDAIHAHHPEPHKITAEDIMQLLTELDTNSYYSNIRNYVRRDTIAFMPQSIGALRFADEMDVDDHRGASRHDTEIDTNNDDSPLYQI